MIQRLFEDIRFCVFGVENFECRTAVAVYGSVRADGDDFVSLNAHDFLQIPASDFGVRIAENPVACPFAIFSLAASIAYRCGIVKMGRRRRVNDMISEYRLQGISCFYFNAAF